MQLPIVQKWLLNIRRAMETMYEDCEFIQNTINAILRSVYPMKANIEQEAHLMVGPGNTPYHLT